MYKYYKSKNTGALYRTDNKTVEIFLDHIRLMNRWATSMFSLSQFKATHHFREEFTEQQASEQFPEAFTQ